MNSLYALLSHKSSLANGFPSELPKVRKYQYLAQESERVGYTIAFITHQGRHWYPKGLRWLNGWGERSQTKTSVFLLSLWLTKSSQTHHLTLFRLSALPVCKTRVLLTIPTGLYRKLSVIALWQEPRQRVFYNPFTPTVVSQPEKHFFPWLT